MKLAAYTRRAVWNGAIFALLVASVGTVSLTLSEPRKKIPLEDLLERQKQNERIRLQGISPDQLPKGALVPQGPPATVTLLTTGDVIGFIEPCG